MDELRARHHEVETVDLDGYEGRHCDWCGQPYPCDFIRADDERRRLLAVVEAALTSEDELAHGEAWSSTRGGLGECAYCCDKWPCRTQRGIDRLRPALDEVKAMSDLRAAVEGLPRNTDITWADDQPFDTFVSLQAVLDLIPEGSVLVTEAALAEALARTGHVGNGHRVTLGIEPDEHRAADHECLFTDGLAEQAAAIIARLRGEK